MLDDVAEMLLDDFAPDVEATDVEAALEAV